VTISRAKSQKPQDSADSALRYRAAKLNPGEVKDKAAGLRRLRPFEAPFTFSQGKQGKPAHRTAKQI